MNDSTDQLLSLLAREGRSLHALLNRLTLDEHAAEDLMQELFVKMGGSRQFRTAQNPAAYLRQAAIHLAFDWRRSKRRSKLAPPGRLEIEAVDASPGADVKLMEREQWQRILDAADVLIGASREVFVLHYLQQLSAEEIAAHIGKTPHQVRALAYKAVSAVREKMGLSVLKEDSHVAR